MNLTERYEAYIKKENLFQKKDRLLLAVSGGVDSVVLCELCRRSGYEFAIAHCNFQLRGAESERDEVSVQSLGEKYSVEVFVKRFDTEKHVAEWKKGVQEVARILRYNWFSELLDRTASTGCNYILTAHHAGDNVETLLMNFFKGTGIYGLHGILPKQGKLIRPLLFASKNDLMEFAEKQHLNYVEDSSNLTETYTRNYFRNRLLPDLEKVFPQVGNNLAENIQRFREVETLYRQSVDLHKKKLLEPRGEEIHIPVLKLQKIIPLSTIVYEIIKDYGFTAHQTNEAIGLLQSESGKYIQSASHRIIRNRNWLIISSKNAPAAENILIEENDKQIEFRDGIIEIKKISDPPNSISDNNLRAFVNADEINFPLLLRKWKQGDYFYPLGMNKKKKLSRFFIDQKLSLTEKEKIWVIETDKKIIWVTGLRIDNRFRITGQTRNILRIKLSVSQ